MSSVVVIGAGLAGMSAAMHLANAGYRVTLLEQSSRLGGRAGSIRLADGTAKPVGSHLFLRCNTEYIRFLERLGTYSQVRLQDKLDLVVLHHGKAARFYAAALPYPLTFAPVFLKYPFLSWHDKLGVVRALWAIWRQEPTLPDETFAQWLQRHQQSNAAAQLIWELISAPTLNSPAQEADAELAMVIFRTAILGRNHSAALGFPGQDLSALYQTLPQYLKDRGSELKVRCGVRQVALSQHAPGFTVTTKEGTLEAQAVVLAIPYDALPRVCSAAILENQAIRAVQNLPKRPIVDVFLTYKTTQTNHPVLAIPGLPALWVFAETSDDGSQQLAISISCPGSLTTQPAADIIKWTISRLHQAFGRSLPGLMDACVIKHQAATFSTHPTVQALRPTNQTSIPGLFLAGDYTATGLPATMEGAVSSGISAAHAVMRYDGQATV
jgi:squalene-associated FAD-dependent desaturase